MRLRHLFQLTMMLVLVACDADDITVDNGSSTSSATVTGVTSVDVDTSDDSYVTSGYGSESFDRTISIVYSTSGSATVSGDTKGIVTVEGNDVTVNNTSGEKVVYNLSGTSTDGFFKVYSSKKQAIILNNLTLTNPDGAAINNQGKKMAYVQLVGANKIADGSTYADEVSSEDMKAAFFSEGQLEFGGDGSLAVTATGKAGIATDDYFKLTEAASVSVTSSAGNGVRGKDSVVVASGTLAVNVSATGKKGISSDNAVRIAGGVTTVVVGGSAGTVDGSLTGTAGVKADTTFTLEGGVLNVTNSGAGGKGINCNGNATFSGGSAVVAVTGADYVSGTESVAAKAIAADGNIAFSGSKVVVSSANNEAVKSKGTLSVTDGFVYATADNDAISSTGNITISGGYVYAGSTGNDGIDGNSNVYINGGVVYAVGSGSPELAIDANSEQGYSITIAGGTVLAFGGIESGATVNQGYVTTTGSAGSYYVLLSSATSTSAIAIFKAPTATSSDVFLSAATMQSGSTYYLRAGAAITGGYGYFDQSYIYGASIDGGTSTQLTAKSGTYSAS